MLTLIYSKKCLKLVYTAKIVKNTTSTHRDKV